MRVQVTPSLPQIPSSTGFFIPVDKKLNICYSNVVEADSPTVQKEKLMSQIDSDVITYAANEIETEVFYRTGWTSDDRFYDFVKELLIDLFVVKQEEVQ